MVKYVDRGVRAKFVRDEVVHYGNLVFSKAGCEREDVDECVVYFLCERHRLLGALYGGPGSDRPPLYKPGVEVFHVFDDVDCMTCLVIEARRGIST